MAYVRWLGSAQAVSQVSTFTVVAPILVGETLKVTCGSSFVTITAATTDEALVAAQVLAALEADATGLEFTDATYALVGLVITATGTAGVPITFGISHTSATGGFTLASTMTATGPNHYDNVANWSGGALPIAADDVVVDGTLPGILYGLSPSLVTFSSFTTTANFTGVGTIGTIGLPITNTLGYLEYRTRFLTINSSKVTLNSGSGTGSFRLNLNLGTVTSEIVVMKTPSSVSTASILLLTNNASTDIIIFSGIVQIGDRGDVAGQVRTLTIGTTGSVLVLKNIPITTVKTSGIFSTYSNVATLTHLLGVTTINDCSVTTLLDIQGGLTSSVIYLSDNTLAAVYLGGVLDVTNELRAKTITALTLKSNGKITDPFLTITYTAITMSSVSKLQTTY